MTKFIGYYRSKGVFHAEGGKDINYDNICFVCVKDLASSDEASGYTFLKDPVRIPYKKFQEVTGYYFEEFLQMYDCTKSSFEYVASYTQNEYGTLKVSSFKVVD